MDQQKRIELIIQELESELIQFAVPKNEINSVLPLNDKRQIKSLIWNLLSSNKWRSKISYQDYSDIMEIILNRLR
jgi:hypothetical protein